MLVMPWITLISVPRMTLTMLGIKPVLLHTYAKEGFMPSPERCGEIINEKTKAIVLVSPNNPVRTPRLSKDEANSRA